ncbi:MAG: TrkH family potassium uptake protein [Marinifilaceae bacterium]
MLMSGWNEYKSNVIGLLHFYIQTIQCFTVKCLSIGFASRIPERNLIYGYSTYIVIGWILLSLPFTHKQPVSVIDNIFMITSAVSTTGLGTVDIGLTYTFWGQLIILMFIQLGGIGYMTLSSYLIFNMTHQFNKIKKRTLNTAFTIPSEFDLASVLRNVIRFTLLFELLGVACLYFFLKNEGISNPLWSAIFHSISSFCTAGFSIYGDSLMQFDTNVPINFVIAILAYIGAMGFIVITDVWNKIRIPNYKITFTSKIILFITTLVTVIGSFIVYLEIDPLVYPNVTDRLLISFFQTMSAMTTVGFNTIDLGNTTFMLQFVLILAMFIGASPSGTGGGVKSTTLSAIYAFMKSKLSHERDVTLCGKRLPTFRVDSAITSFISYQLFLLVGVSLLFISESLPLRDILFEATSALGTVGLSTGITASFSTFGKVILISLMFIGRIGTMIFGSFMLIRMKRKVISEEVRDLAV